MFNVSYVTGSFNGSHFSSQEVRESKSRKELGKLSVILLFLTSLLVILAMLTGSDDIYYRLYLD